MGNINESDISLTSHSLLCKLTVNGLPCGYYAAVASRNTDHRVFPRLNAGYRLRGMHESCLEQFRGSGLDTKNTGNFVYKKEQSYG